MDHKNYTADSVKFSEYVILGRQGLMIEPFAYLSPYTALQDKLFKKFTVLSNFPAYHGVLALMFMASLPSIEAGDGRGL